MVDNYDYFVHNLCYVIKVMHRNICYGASQLFINPHILPVYEKNSPKFTRSSSSLQPHSRLLVRRREERRRHTSLRSTAKEELLWWFSVVVVLAGVVSKR